MSKNKYFSHISKTNPESNSLPPLQKKILLHLAENNPQTINEVAKKIGHQYKASWVAFESLKKKDLIQEVDLKEYRNRSYPLFWLTDVGIILSCIEGASLDSLIEKAEKIYPNNKTLHIILDLASTFNKNVWRTVYYSAKAKGTFDYGDLANILLIQMAAENTPEKLSELKCKLKKYSETYDTIKSSLEAMCEIIKDFFEED
ncbi:MAG: hypothetical protein QXX34_04475 [Candidatus Bathyarchaeia archaeon]